jgi:hypothetical protein
MKKHYIRLLIFNLIAYPAFALIVANVGEYKSDTARIIWWIVIITCFMVSTVFTSILPLVKIIKKERKNKRLHVILGRMKTWNEEQYGKR